MKLLALGLACLPSTHWAQSLPTFRYENIQPYVGVGAR